MGIPTNRSQDCFPVFYLISIILLRNICYPLSHFRDQEVKVQEAMEAYHSHKAGIWQS